MHEVEAIASIPVSIYAARDILLIWHFDRKGGYTVNSGYHAACHLYLNSQDCLIEVNWKSVWKLCIPPKVKGFIWKALRKILPTNTSLLDWRVQCSLACKSCSEVEDETHAVLRCNKAAAVRCLWGKLRNITLGSYGSFIDLLRNYEVVILEEFCDISRKLWWARNQLLWHNKVVTPYTIVAQAVAFS